MKITGNLIACNFGTKLVSVFHYEGEGSGTLYK